MILGPFLPVRDKTGARAIFQTGTGAGSTCRDDDVVAPGESVTLDQRLRDTDRDIDFSNLTQRPTDPTRTPARPIHQPAGYLACTEREDLPETASRDTTLVKRLHIARDRPRQMLAHRAHQPFKGPL